MRYFVSVVGLCLVATGMLLADDQHFEQQVRPLLIAKCVKCHGAEKSEAALRLQGRDDLQRLLEINEAEKATSKRTSFADYLRRFGQYAIQFQRQSGVR